VTELVDRDAPELVEKIAAFIARAKAVSGKLNLFLAEELLFFKLVHLPLDTPNIKEAIGYQIELLTPFADESIWRTFATVREEEGYRITLFAARSKDLELLIQLLVDGGYQIVGLYPEHQRYVNRGRRKGQWGLVLPGRFTKAFIFSGLGLEERLLCSSEPSFPEAVEICRADLIFKVDPSLPLPGAGDEAVKEGPYFDYQDARLLLGQKSPLRSYNLLPASYQRADYFKTVIAVLVIFNLVTLSGLGAVKGYRLYKAGKRINREINAIMPQVREVKKLRAQEQEFTKAIGRLDSMGSNLDLITLLAKLTAELPLSSYLDQIRLDPKDNKIHLEGYTEDVGELTAKLQTVGETQLKSTSRRKDKTYFHVEISPP
jgi:hypothetical protein